MPHTCVALDLIVRPPPTQVTPAPGAAVPVNAAETLAPFVLATPTRVEEEERFLLELEDRVGKV